MTLTDMTLLLFHRFFFGRFSLLDGAKFEWEKGVCDIKDASYAGFIIEQSLRSLILKL